MSARAAHNRLRRDAIIASCCGVFVAAMVGAAVVILRPTTLRIAVGPAGSDDVQLVQGFAQSFARNRDPVRLSIVTTAGPVDSIAALSSGRDVVVSYVVNSFDFWQVARDARLYWPRFVRVRLVPSE